MEELTKKEYKTGVTLIILIPLLLLIYLLATDFIETNKLYSQDIKWFYFSMWDYVDNNSCIDFYKASLSYYNDVSDSQYKFTNGKYENLMYAYIPIRKICDFNEFWIRIKATNVSFSPAIIDEEKLNLTRIEYEGNDSYKIFIKNGSWDLYKLEILIPIKEKFFNYYFISDGNKLGFEVFTINYKDSIFGGYIADENSFNVVNGNLTEERPIISNKYKWFKFNSDSVLILFNPKSKWWFLFQKVLDALVLGIIAGAVLLFPYSKSKQIFKKLFKDINHLFKMENRLTIKDFLQEHSLNLVALSVFLLVTITLSSHQGALSRPLGVLSAGISYFLIIDLIKRDTGKEGMNLGIMKSFIVLFTILFCIWVILNLVIPFQNNLDIIMLILWLIFILGVPIKLYTS